MSIPEIIVDRLISFPNPTNGNITVKLPKVETSVNVSVYSIVGGLLESGSYQNTDKIELDLSGYLGGVYFMRVQTTDGKVSVLKIMRR